LVARFIALGELGNRAHINRRHALASSAHSD
jgi:hypothetical protein